MRHASKIAVAATAALVGFSSFAPAFAQVTGSIPSSTSSAAADSGMGARAQGSPVLVTRVDSLDNDEVRQFENLSASTLAAVQQELASNPALTAELQAQGVQLNNVVDIQTFSNGGALVYVR